MQQARKLQRGENRRGGAKPRGRNEAGRVVPSARGERPGNRLSLWSGRAEVMSVEGQSGHEPQERQGPWRPVGASALVGTAARGPATVRTLHRRCTREGNLEGAGNGQGVPTTDGLPSRSDAPVLSSRAPDRQRSKAWRAQGRTHRPAHRDRRPCAAARRASRRQPTLASISAAPQAS